MSYNGDSEDSTGSGKRIGTGLGRRQFVQAGGAGLIAVTAGCVGGDDDDTATDGDTVDPNDDEPITIGGLFPMPGEFPGGTAQLEATQLRVKQQNEAGGLLGREVELEFANTNLDPSTALDRYREMQLEHEVNATFGLFGSEEGLRVGEEVGEHENIFVFGGVSTTDIEQLIKDDYDSYKYLFRCMNNGVDFGWNLAVHANEMWADWGYERIGVAVEDIEGWRADIEPVAVENLPDDIEVAFTEVFSSDTTDFAPILDRGESEEIDFLFSFSAHGGSALQVQWAQRQPSFASGGADVFSGMPAHYEATDGLIEYVWTYVPGSGPGYEATERTHEFIDANEAEFGHVPLHSQAYTQYDAVDSWMRAVEAAGTLDEDAVVEYMENDLEFEGATGYVDYAEMDSDPHPADGEVYPHRPKYGADGVQSPIIQWQEVDGEGQSVGLWPDTVRTGEYQPPPWLE